MFTEDQIEAIFLARKENERHFFERQEFDLTDEMLLAIETIAKFDTFESIDDSLLEILL